MFTRLSNAQSKQYLDAVAVHESLVAAVRQAHDYRGGMHWKTVANKDYLYKTLDRLGNAKSFGVRSVDTERIYTEFTRRKTELTERVRELKSVAAIHARVNAALRIGSVPNEVADVCIALNEANLLGKSITVIGTNAMHAYGFLAGVRFPGDIMATTDVDLLWNHKAKLSLAAAEEVSEAGLMGILKRADKSYEQDEQNAFRARSKTGFMVDLIRQMPVPPWADEPDRFFQDDLVATDIQNVRWLVSAPRIEQPVVANDGRVFMMVVPDPRAYAIYKVWLSTADDREPIKRRRDIGQARELLSVIEQELPHLNQWGAFKSFPQALRDQAVAEIGGNASAAHEKSGSLAQQWGAVPGKRMANGRIVALSEAEVIQDAGRGKHVVWDRRQLQDGNLAIGEILTIHASGRVDRSVPGNGLGR